MDPRLALCAKFLADGRASFEGIISQGIEARHFKASPSALMVFEFCHTYVLEHETGFPSRQAVAGMTSIDTGEPSSEELTWWVQAVRDVYLTEGMLSLSRKVSDYCAVGQPHEAFQEVEKALRDYQRDSGSQQSVPFFSILPKVLEYHNLVQGNFRGVPFFWDAINNATLGMQPEDFILFVARPGIGKTWVLIIHAIKAWQQGKRVLFLSTEISLRTVVARGICAMLGIPYSSLHGGALNAEEYQKISDCVDNPPEGADRLMLAGGDFDFNLNSLGQLIVLTEPDVLFVDGAYLLHVDKVTRNEKGAMIFDELKRLAKRYKIPVCISTQFNREVDPAKRDSISLAKIGLSDAAGQNADMAFALFQSDDMRMDNKMTVVCMKGREALIPHVDINWDLDGMNFDPLVIGFGDADDTRKSSLA